MDLMKNGGCALVNVDIGSDNVKNETKEDDNKMNEALTKNSRKQARINKRQKDASLDKTEERLLFDDLRSGLNDRRDSGDSIDNRLLNMFGNNTNNSNNEEKEKDKDKNKYKIEKDKEKEKEKPKLEDEYPIGSQVLSDKYPSVFDGVKSSDMMATLKAAKQNQRSNIKKKSKISLMKQRMSALKYRGNHHNTRHESSHNGNNSNNLNTTQSHRSNSFNDHNQSNNKDSIKTNSNNSQSFNTSNYFGNESPAHQQQQQQQQEEHNDNNGYANQRSEFAREAYVSSSHLQRGVWFNAQGFLVDGIFLEDGTFVPDE